VLPSTVNPTNRGFFYGARPEQLDRRIRDKLSGRIIPSTITDKPMAPNSFDVRDSDHPSKPRLIGQYASMTSAHTPSAHPRTITALTAMHFQRL
jgi:hypothetical protein